IRCRPAAPLAAVSTAKPSISSRVCKDSRISASSSMMSTAPASPGVPFNSVRGMTAVSDMHCLPAQGKIQRKRRSCTRLALHANLARMFLDDAVGDRKAETSAAGLALARRSLGSKERIVNAWDVLGRNARSGVGHAYAHALAVERGHTQRAPARHGVFGVQK